jgi:DNA-binding HxlR family transcriptional regulator
MVKRHTQTCAIAAFLNLFGDPWSLMIMREALYGTTRFTDFQRNTGAAKNLLSDRLTTLVREGLLEKVEVGTTGTRYAYHLTPKGESFRPTLSAIILWSNQHLYGKGNEPTMLVTAEGREPVRGVVPQLADNSIVSWDDLEVVTGPGASSAAKRRFPER